jgi:3',5'-cyclic AMP phosphodiesterase CpdA
MHKIIHLSDLHLGYKGNEMVERFTTIIGGIIALKQPAEDYAVVITGDLTENACEENFENALMCIEKLKVSGYTVLVTPGNHDCGTGGIGSRRKLKLFGEMFYGDPELKFPKVDILGDTAFIALNSMEGELHWFHKEFFDAIGADGEIGKDQLERLGGTLLAQDVKKCKYRVVYMHHHPVKKGGRFHILKDKERLGEVIKECGNVDALLCGHEHQSDVFHGFNGVRRVSTRGAPGTWSATTSGGRGSITTAWPKRKRSGSVP